MPEAPQHNQLMNIAYNDKELTDKRSIGRGGFGIVQSAKWRGTLVAIKLPEKIVGTDLQQVEAELLKEALAMNKVRAHKHVLPLMGVTSDPIGLMMPLAEGGSVDALLVNGPSEPSAGGAQRLATGRHTTTWRHAVRIMADAALGIAHLHAEGVIHRDIAARNVLLDAAGRGLVSDFGMARIRETAESQHGTITQLGPYRYEAPESLKLQAEERGGKRTMVKKYSYASDVFSFGVFMYEVMAGHEPWPGFAPEDVISKVRQGQRMAIPPGDGVIAQLMRECWAHAPGDRPSMEHVADRLEAHWGALAGDERSVSSVVQGLSTTRPVVTSERLQLLYSAIASPPSLKDTSRSKHLPQLMEGLANSPGGVGGHGHTSLRQPPREPLAAYTQTVMSSTAAPIVHRLAAFARRSSTVAAAAAASSPDGEPAAAAAAAATA